MAEHPLLQFNNLSAGFIKDRAYVNIIDNISFQVNPRETVAVVGESGSGKSVSSLCIMGLLPRPYGKIIEGEIM